MAFLFLQYSTSGLLQTQHAKSALVVCSSESPALEVPTRMPNFAGRFCHTMSVSLLPHYLICLSYHNQNLNIVNTVQFNYLRCASFVACCAGSPATDAQLISRPPKHNIGLQCLSSVFTIVLRSIIVKPAIHYNTPMN